MFKKIIFTSSLLLATMAIAKPNYEASPILSAKEIRDRFELNADIYHLDESGKRILDVAGRSNTYRFDSDKGVIDSNWGSGFNAGFIGIKHHWQVEEDGTIKVTIEEYTDDSGKKGTKKILDKKDYVLTNFEPIIWEAKNIKGQKYIVRFIPNLRVISTPISVDSLPVAGSGVSISDSQGYLWAEDVKFNGKYSGVKTHRGMIVLSYKPFAAGKDMGFAEGHLITLKVNAKMKINLKSESSFLPSGVTARVYAAYFPDKKSSGVDSVHTFDSDKESSINETLKN